MLEISAKSGKEKESEEEGYLRRREHIHNFTVLSACLPVSGRRSLCKWTMES